jgi:hypothetical protein
MRSARPSRLAGTIVGLLAFGAAVLFPRALGDGAERTASRGVAEACGSTPGAPGLVERIDARLRRRLPRLDVGDRCRLARTLVGEAAAARIDPLLVLAVIQVESSYDPDALSHRGARGLMQLREPTFRRELERAGLRWEDAHDPAVNVKAGIRYLRRLLDAFGREEVALMAYNAGPNRILAYLRDEGGIPERYLDYPRKVKAEHGRLRKLWPERRRPAVAVAEIAPGPE